jgi:hypothetical protein
MDARESLEKKRMVVMLEKPRARAMGMPERRHRNSKMKRNAVVICPLLAPC